MSEIEALSKLRTKRILRRIGWVGDGLERLTLIEAPMGHDKTPVALAWMKQQVDRSIRVAWTSVAPSSSEETAWRIIATQLGTDAQQGVDAYQAASKAVQSLNLPTVLVLENYERITSPSFDKQLSSLLYKSGHLHLIVVGRNVGALTNPVVTGPIPSKTVDRAELRLTDEDASLLSLSGTLDPLECTEIINMVDGWPHACRALVKKEALHLPLSARRNLMLEGLLAASTSDFDRKVLQAVVLNPHVSTRTLHRSFAGEEDRLLQALDSLSQTGLIERQESRGVRRYLSVGRLGDSPLLREPNWLSPEQKRSLHLHHAGDVYSFDPVQAVSILLKEEKYDEATEMLSEQSGYLTKQNETFLGFVRQVPLEHLQAHPYLLVLWFFLERLAGSASLSTMRRLAQKAYDVAIEQSLAPNAGEVLSTLAMAVPTQTTLGLWEEAETSARALHSQLERLDETSRRSFGSALPNLYLIAASTALLTGNYTIASDAAEKAQVAAEEMSVPAAYAGACALRALGSVLFGNPSDAVDQLASGYRVLELSQTKPATEVKRNLHSAHMLVTSAMPEGDFANWPPPPPILLGSLSLEAPDEMWPFALLAEIVYTRRSAGAYQALQNLRTRLTDLPRGLPLSPYGRRSLLLTAADLATVTGRQALAFDLLEAEGSDSDAAMISYLRAELFSAQYEEVLQSIPGVLERAADSRSLGTLNTMGAIGAHRLGDDKKAAEFLCHASGGLSRRLSPSFLSLLPYEDLVSLAAAMGEEKGLSVDEVEAIPSVARSHAYLLPSRAERLVLKEMAKGLSTTEIAKLTGRSVNTVRFHERNLMAKAKVKGRQLVVVEAVHLGLLGDAPEMKAADFLDYVQTVDGLTAQ